MSINAPDHYSMQFATTLELLLQQKGSKLKGFVMEGNHVGKQASPVDQIGAVEMQTVTGRFSDIGRVDAALDRRWVYPSDFDLPQYLDKKDELRKIIDPMGTYVQNGLNAAGRKYDDLIIDAFFATAKTGETGATSTSFPSGQQVAVTFGSTGNSNLSVKKLKEARRLFLAAEVDLDMEQIYCAMQSSQDSALLDEAQIVSTEYNERPVLVDGKIRRFLGFDFIHSERLDVNGSSHRRVPVWVKSGMHLGHFGTMQTSVKEDITKSNHPWQIYLALTAGATRLEEEKVVELICAE